MMSIKSVAAAFALAACIGLAGCASQKEPAEQAMAAIEETLKTFLSPSDVRARMSAIESLTHESENTR